MLAPSVEIEIGGRVRVMRPTVKAMMAIEQEMGKSTMAIVSGIMAGDMSVSLAMAVVYNCLNGSTDRLERDKIAEDLEAKGLVAYIPAVTKLFEAHLQGNPVGKPQPEKLE